MLGGRGQWAAYVYKKKIYYDALHFHIGSLKLTFSKYSFGREGGGHKKEYSVYAFDNVDNSG